MRFPACGEPTYLKDPGVKSASLLLSWQEYPEPCLEDDGCYLAESSVYGSMVSEARVRWTACDAGD